MAGKAKRLARARHLRQQAIKEANRRSYSPPKPKPQEGCWRQCHSRFCSRWDEAHRCHDKGCSDTGRTAPPYVQATNTGRLSSTGPNPSNVPKGICRDALCYSQVHSPHTLQPGCPGWRAPQPVPTPQPPPERSWPILLAVGLAVSLLGGAALWFFLF
jgi:hypothetical protein